MCTGYGTNNTKSYLPKMPGPWDSPAQKPHYRTSALLPLSLPHESCYLGCYILAKHWKWKFAKKKTTKKLNYIWIVVDLSLQEHQTNISEWWADILGQNLTARYESALNQKGWWLYTRKKEQILADSHKGKKYLIVITWSYQDNGKFQRPWSAAMEGRSQNKT